MTAIAGLLSVLAVGAGLIVTNNYNRDQQQLALQGQITDRFTKAVEQLGQPGPQKIDVRLGAIYALQRIMRDSGNDQPAVVDILSAFVRVHAPAPHRATTTPSTEKPSPRPVDIQAALTVLARRDQASDGEGRVDLSRANLSSAALPAANLRGADMPESFLRGVDLSEARLGDASLSGADLREAYLDGADLHGADLSSAELNGASLNGSNANGANLFDADLRGAHLSGAQLAGTHLPDADLRGADLSSADLRGARLDGADLRRADLHGADLRGADLIGADLAPEQLRCASVDEATFLPAGVVRPSPDASRSDPQCQEAW